MAHMTDDEQRAAVRHLVNEAMRLKPMTREELAERLPNVKIGWLGNLLKGYRTVGAGQTAPVTFKSDVLARVALELGISAEQLRDVGRDDAAKDLETLQGRSGRSGIHLTAQQQDRLLGALGDIRKGADEAIKILGG